jgi:arylsulfatase
MTWKFLIGFPTIVAHLFAASAGAGEAPRRSSPARRPSVVLIVADDLGYAEVGCYGQKKIRTPRIDRMAAEGLRFTRFYAGSPVCAPSRCCLLTGRHGGHAWVRDNADPPREQYGDEFTGQIPIPAGEVTLAELFRGQHHATAAMGKWGLGPRGSEGDPQNQGFDHFFGYYCQRHAHNHYPRYLYDDGRKTMLEGNPGGATGRQFSHDLFEARALRFLDDHRDREFFLFLPFTVPHVAVQVPEDSLAEYKGLWDDPPYHGEKGYQSQPWPRACYAAMVTRLDRSVGRILDRLEELGRTGDTLVIFTSDNGPTHDGAGGSDSAFFESAGPLRGLKGSVYEGGLRVPFIARWPGKIEAGRVTDVPGTFPDVIPTLMELIGAGGTVPPGLDGISLLPTLMGEPRKQRSRHHMFWEFAGYGGQQAVLTGDWKAVRREMHRGNPAIELYNLKDDPGEHHDVAAMHPEIVRQLAHIMASDRTPSTLYPLPVPPG